MNASWNMRWLALVALNVVGWCVLGFYQTGNAAADQPQTGPFANSVQQRFDIIDELRGIHDELKVQNELLRSGKLTVIVSDAHRP